MNTEILISRGGGLLSQFTVLINFFYHNQNIELNGPIYLNKGKGLARLVTGYLKEPIDNFYQIPNWWDSVFSQSSNNITNTIEVDSFYLMHHDYLASEESLKELSFARNFVQKHFTLHPQLISLVKTWKEKLNIDKNTLAVHLRLTDLNDVHSGELGKCSIMDYVKIINLALKENPNITKIFVASESTPNIEKLQSLIDPPVVFIPNLKRTTNPDENFNGFYKEQVEFLKQPDYSREVFLDLLLLSQCHILVGRMSAVTNTSIIFNNNLVKYYCVNTLKYD